MVQYCCIFLELLDVFLIISLMDFTKVNNWFEDHPFPKLRIVLSRRRNNDFTARLMIAVVLATFLIFANVNYPYGGAPSTASMVFASKQVNSRYSVPSSLADVAYWMRSNTNQSQEFRIAVFPGGGSTLTSSALSSYLPSTSISILSLNSTLFWNSGIQWDVQHYTNVTSAMKMMNLAAVKYIVVLKVHIKWDNPLTYEGPARFYPAGFSWDFNYVPAGSWQNWSIVFNNTNGLSEVADLPAAVIYTNVNFYGKLVSYKWNSSYNLNDLYSIQGSFFYKSNPVLLPQSSWIGFRQFPMWNLSINNGGYSLLGGPMPESYTYASISQDLDLLPNHYYQIHYSVEGQFINNSMAVLYFFSGSNFSGRLLYQVSGTPVSGNIVNLTNVNLFVHTPDVFGSVQLSLLYNRFISNNNQTRVVINNPNISNVTKLAKTNSTYSFVNPTYGIVSLNYNGPVLLYFSSLYQNGWTLKMKNDSIPGKVFYNGFFDSMVFVVNNSTDRLSIAFEPQVVYHNQLLSIAVLWGILLSSPILYGISVYIYRRFHNRVRK